MEDEGPIKNHMQEGREPSNKRGVGPSGRYFSDLSDSIGNPRAPKNMGHVIHWVSIASKQTVHFKAFLTEFDDKYESKWNDQTTYGRMDPISTFERTTRTISLGWDVPAASIEEAKWNLGQAEKFLAMLYPNYEVFDLSTGGIIQPEIKGAAPKGVAVSDTNSREQNNAQRNRITQAARDKKRQIGVMVASPLFKLKFSNLIMRPGVTDISDENANTAGLVGKLSGLTYSPDIESGFFGHTEVDDVAPGVLIPQTIKFSCQFTVLHTDPLGWSKNRKRSDNFPYGASKVRKTS